MFLKRKDPTQLPANIDRQLNVIRNKLGSPPDLVTRHLPLPRGRWQVAVVFLKGFAETEIISESINSSLSRPTMQTMKSPSQIATNIASSLPFGKVKQTTSIDNLISSLLAGDVAVVAENTCALILEIPPTRRRPIETPNIETGIRGPQEAFVENVNTNLMLIRSRLRSPDLRVMSHTLGERSNTTILVAYIDDIADPDVVKEVTARLKRIKTDIIYDVGTIVDFIEDSPWGLWPQIKLTQRPDVVIANLAEGRIAILVDGTPFAIILPMMFWQMMQAVDDYVGRFMVTTWLRALRLFAFGFSLTGPGLYVAITTYHQELIPPALALTLAASREAVPFPAAVEALLMKLALDLLIEAGLRLPRAVGPAVSIVGALVLGDAAVTAGLASSGMVIVIAGTAISVFAIPDVSLAETVRYLTYIVIILAAIAGLFGVAWSILMISIGLIAQHSFGLPLSYPVAPGKPRYWKDVFIRSPAWMLRNRPRATAQDEVRTTSPKTQSGERWHRR